jgi:WD40 repeat protein
MKSRYKKIFLVAMLPVVCASLFILYYHFLRQPSQVVSGSVTLFRTFSGHTAGVQAVDFSPTGETFASGSIDGIARIWRRDKGQAILDLKHPVGVTALVYSPDGSTLASGSYDGKVRLWRLSDGTLMRTLDGSAETVWSVAFSPDGKSLASAGEDKTIRLWNVDQGDLLKTLSGHLLNIWSVTFSPDGNRLVSGSFDKTIKIWDRRTGQPERTIDGHTQAVLDVDFSPDGKRLVSCGDDSTVRIWNTQDWSLVNTLTGSEHVYSVAFSPDGNRILSGGRDRSTFGELLQNFLGETENNKGVTVRLWNAADGRLIQSFAENADDVMAVAFSPDGRWIASASLDKRVCVWQLAG